MFAFTVGLQYRNIPQGRVATCIAVDEEGSAWLRWNVKTCVNNYTTAFPFSRSWERYDPPVSVKGWVNVYPGYTSVVYATKEKADLAVSILNSAAVRMKDRDSIEKRTACVYVEGQSKCSSE